MNQFTQSYCSAESSNANQPAIKHFGLWRGRETRQRVAVEGISLPRCSIPLSVGVSHYLHRHNDAFVAKLVRSGNAIVYDFAFGIDSEFDRPHQMTVIDDFDFVIARIFTHQVKRTEHGLVLFACLVPGADVCEVTFPARPLELALR